VSRPILLALLALAASAGIVESASARDYEDRREARRTAIVAGAVRKEIAMDRAEDRYEDCVRGSSYDSACERQRYRDERDARVKGRRTAVVVGATR
jgi:hypothetical protein